MIFPPVEYLFIMALVFHPTSPEITLCVQDIYTDMYMCEDYREKMYNCNYMYNVAECPKLSGV